jgi:hypothetical protein
VAEQATGTVQGTGTGGTLAHVAPEAHHHGKPISWVAVTVIIVGFIVGGAAMLPPLAPPVMWWLFWLGAGIAAVGCIMTLFAKTFDDWY